MVGWCLPLSIVEKSLEKKGYLNREEERELEGHWIRNVSVIELMLLAL